MAHSADAGLLVRADTRTGVGVGHALRQAALIESWTACGAAATVMIDDADPWLARRLTRAGAEVVTADPVDLGLSDLVERAHDPSVQWVVLDGYAYGSRVQGALADAPARLAVVDDHGHHDRYEAAVVVDPNLGPRLAVHERRPPGSALLHGPRFALLRREFRGAPAPRQGPPRRMVVLTGGAGSAGGDLLVEDLTGRLADQALDVEVTTPAVVGCRDDLGRLLASAAFAVSASGSTAWELAHLGLPAVLFALADNQVPVGRAMEAHGAARYQGLVDLRDEEARHDLVDAALDLVVDEGAAEAMRRAGPVLVDGHGAARVRTELQSDLMDLRTVEAGDARLLWEWANDPVVRASSFTPGAIGWEEHRAWVDRRLADPSCRSYVALASGRPWGLVRFDGIDGVQAAPEISFSVAAAARGGGAAAGLIRAGVRLLFAETPAPRVTARVKPGNGASLSVLASADFEVEAGDTPGPVVLTYLRGRDGRA